jgi:RNA polymerase sigma-70 factor (ECF subfamily)
MSPPLTPVEFLRPGVYDPRAMAGKGNDVPRESAVYCLVPRDLAPRLLDPLVRHFRDATLVQALVEHRARERRSPEDRRRRLIELPAGFADRRRIRGRGGRRVGERRAALIGVQAPDLPRKLRPHAGRLTFVERLEPTSERAEDLDTARLVNRLQSGEHELFADLYLRYFDRVYGYLRQLLGDPHDAEEAAQQVFVQVLGGLDKYERRSEPFCAWLFVVVRNYAMNHLRKQGRVEVMDPSDLDLRREHLTADSELDALRWVSDDELTFLIGRLPLAQRQVLMLSYMVGLDIAEIATVLERSRADVRKLRQRALGLLRERLTALGRAPEQHRGQRRMLRRVSEASVLRARRYSLVPGRTVLSRR